MANKYHTIRVPLFTDGKVNGITVGLLSVNGSVFLTSQCGIDGVGDEKTELVITPSGRLLYVPGGRLPKPTAILKEF